MKKIIVALVALMSVVAAKAAAVDWNVGGTVDQDGYKVYLLTTIADSYDSVKALESAAIASATIGKSGRTYGTGDQRAEGDAVTKNGTYYFAIVSSDTATSFNYIEAAGMGALVYDAQKQETSPGTFDSLNAAAIAAGSSKSFGGNVPEPTTGLLVLLGIAGLSLKRKLA